MSYLTFLLIVTLFGLLFINAIIIFTSQHLMIRAKETIEKLNEELENSHTEIAKLRYEISGKYEEIETLKNQKECLETELAKHPSLRSMSSICPS